VMNPCSPPMAGGTRREPASESSSRPSTSLAGSRSAGIGGVSPTASAPGLPYLGR
jgi:hypothetical protein